MSEQQLRNESEVVLWHPQVQSHVCSPSHMYTHTYTSIIYFCIFELSREAECSRRPPRDLGELTEVLHSLPQPGW